MFKNLLKNYLKNRGLAIKPKRIQGWNTEYVSQLGQPNTVFDIGVGPGTPALYASFPKAKMVLCEPLKEYFDNLDEFKEKYDIILVPKAIGSEESEKTIKLHLNWLEMTTFNDRTDLTKTNSDEELRTVSITTLDKVLADNPNLPKPFLVKIDTEGFELEVLKGATEVLKHTEFVISETSIAPRFENGYTFFDFASEMKKNGFELYDFLSLAPFKDRSKPGALYGDAVFRRSKK